MLIWDHTLIRATRVYYPDKTKNECKHYMQMIISNQKPCLMGLLSEISIWECFQNFCVDTRHHRFVSLLSHLADYLRRIYLILWVNHPRSNYSLQLVFFASRLKKINKKLENYVKTGLSLARVPHILKYDLVSTTHEN